MQAYQAFDAQNYKNAKRYIDRLLLIDKSKPSYILAGRIASKLGNVNTTKPIICKIHNYLDLPAKKTLKLIYLNGTVIINVSYRYGN
jgi:hypothetical protein